MLAKRLVVTLVVAAMMGAMAVPAFAQNPFGDDPFAFAANFLKEDQQAADQDATTIAAKLFPKGDQPAGGPKGGQPKEQPNGAAGGQQPPSSAPKGDGPASASGSAVVSEAAKYMGTPYYLGGAEDCVPFQKMDCSCLTMTVYAKFGFSLPDSPGGQMGYGRSVSGPPAAGDLLFWNEDGSGITHNGIATGNGTTIHASANPGYVTETPIDAIPGYVGARRLL